ncbi:hypothetical protein B296_00029716 [Ensete ventricosum]|uniref:Uncharacterized protein n=1 Tax=Ensete ventricosum TaxID=4639 RepID=A0A426ZDL6_ENSVE|nr:hypothetical protein B296_00029716 [Ensete ventricosum]
MLQWANQYVAVETLVAGKREDHKKSRGDKPQGQPSGTPRRRDKLELPSPRPLPIPLNSTRTEVFLQICDKGLLRTPNPLRAKIGGRDKRSLDPKITFGGRNEAYPDHDDALVISAQIANVRVKRIMVDTKSYADILYFDAFQKLSLTNKDLLPMISTLTGFTGDLVSHTGTTVLPVIIGGESK